MTTLEPLPGATDQRAISLCFPLKPPCTESARFVNVGAQSPADSPANIFFP